jgi:hypothetical protein
MLIANVETVFIVGAGFSHHAGLPLTSRFTEGILEARQFSGGPSRILVDFLGRFIHDAFDHSTKVKAKHWPDLEDLFTCVDLSANSGHHLGSTFAPADLRTVRRAMLSRTIRMLHQKYEAGRKKKDLDWKKLDDFFARIDRASVGFISMNWDTVIERKLALTQDNRVFDYCCDASRAIIPDPPEKYSSKKAYLQAEDYYSSKKEYLKVKKVGQVIKIAAVPVDRKIVDRSTPIVKIHGSANWLYCDNCRQLFWFDPGQSPRIADQLIRPDDVMRIKNFLSKKGAHVEETLKSLDSQPRVKCLCSEEVALGTRIATFSYRKALEFPMFQKSWFAAEELLRGAVKWVFIGYSLPAADYEFKYLLKRIQLSRRKQPEFIVISGGTKDDVGRTYDNYHRFFGRAINKLSFFSSGLTQDAVTTICR